MRINFLLIFLILGSVAVGQKITVAPSAGLSYRTDSRQFPKLRKVHQYFLDTPFRGGGFIGLNAGIVLGFNKLGLAYHPNFRYGKVTDRWVIGNDKTLYQKFEKAWLVDHEFGLFYKPEKVRFGIGYSIFNDNAQYRYLRHEEEAIQNAEHSAISIYTAMPVKNWVEVELKCYYIREGDPKNPRIETWLLGLRVFKEFDLTKKNKN